AEGKQQKLLKKIKEFGQDSGLLKEINIRRLGKHATDPFQVMIKAFKGPEVNIADVGYGVSQAIPVVVESATLSKRQTLLVQQPEVHLHPRAQAALGSFFAGLVSETDNRFVIETHSDYMIDRVRREIALGAIKPKDVQILFFNRPGLDTDVYSVSLDDMGNILDAPGCYREFFLEEELAMLSR
ncbi:MAG: AAA family ATPase, partial [Planctomycetota bacterium]